jgi:hypothetical protein
MTTLTDANKRIPSLSELDQKIATIRAMAASGDLSDYARYELSELLEIRRKVVLGRFEQAN